MSAAQKSISKSKNDASKTGPARRTAETEASKLRRAGELLDKIHREAVDLARRAAETRARMS